MGASLTTLDNVKAYLGAEVAAGNSSDGLLTLLISACSDWARNYCNDNFLADDYDHMADGYGTTSLMLPYGPITDVKSVQIDGQTIPARVGGGFGFSYNNRLNSINLTGYVFTPGKDNVEISYRAGYESLDTVPADLQFAVIRLVAYRFRERSRLGKSSATMGGKETSTYSDVSAPADVLQTLDNFRRRYPCL